MFDFLRYWHRRRAAAHIGAAEWRATVANLPLLDGLSTAELEQLRELACRFLDEKNWSRLVVWNWHRKWAH